MTGPNERLVSEFVEKIMTPCDLEDGLKTFALLDAHPNEADAAFARVTDFLKEEREKCGREIAQLQAEAVRKSMAEIEAARPHDADDLTILPSK